MSRRTARRDGATPQNPGNFLGWARSVENRGAALLDAAVLAEAMNLPCAP
jgi:hypothetical protein